MSPPVHTLRRPTLLQEEASSWLHDLFAREYAMRPDANVAALTLQPNLGLGPEDDQRLRKMFELWARRVCIEVVGLQRRNLARQIQLQPRYWMVAQPGEIGWHLHGIGLFPLRSFPDHLRIEGMESIWKDVTRGGSLKLDFRPDPWRGVPAPDRPGYPDAVPFPAWQEQLKGWINYMIRDFRTRDAVRDPWLFPRLSQPEPRTFDHLPPGPDRSNLVRREAMERRTQNAIPHIFTAKRTRRDPLTLY